MAYVPRRGDFISITLDPQAGHEQRGRRPAFVITDFDFNRVTGMAMLCPITNTRRNWPFHVSVTGSSLTGFIMVDQLKSLDYQARGAKFIEAAAQPVVDEVLSLIDAIFFQ